VTDGVTDSVTDGVTGTIPQVGTRLHRLLGGDATAWLVRRVRDRL